MTKTATLTAPSSRSFFERVLDFLDHTAELAAKNGHTTYFGL
jgi:hypothetical protein